MDGDQNEFGSVHEGNVDIGPQTSNNLELNVEQNCCSPNVARASDSQSCPPAANVLSCDTVLGIGTEFESNDHAYRFYNKYARLLGFNVRKDWINRSKVHGQVVSRKFTCSQEGWKDKRDANVKKHRKETRSGCLAHMIVNRQPDGKYQLYENTLKYLSHVVKDAESFANDLRRSIYDPKDEEFTRAWEAMLEKYNLQQNEWLRWIYREREMGCCLWVVDEQRYKEIEASEENEQVFAKANGHALKVLDHTNIKVVPSQYILDRWTGDARLGNLREIKQLTMQGNPNMVVASCYKDLCHRLLKLSVRASESMEAYQFSARQLDEVMVGVEKILALKAEEGQVITSSNIDANASENEPAEIFLNGHAIEDQDESNRANGGKDRRATSDRGYLTTMTFNGADSDRILNVEVSPPNTVVCISSPSSAYVSSHSASPNPILQGMYSFEANQVVHCMYEQTNHVLDHQSNSNTLQPPNIFSNQQDCPGQSQLLQEPIIQSTYHASMPCNNQMRQGIDLDIQNPHSSSFLLYDHRYRSSESA
ncbi:hypothetical protein D0Y65_054233 [Glycine soja]|uniref:Protein FAR1-RELATED SEQUENCE n=1 Tax=Glycine soja TaxID=3848 RepID=A0A445F5M0_GLYSO|nr:hypothetical protein D0Y65_054233 [Glycine soja]